MIRALPARSLQRRWSQLFGKSSRPIRNRSRQRCRLGIELLEVRTVPAAVVGPIRPGFDDVVFTGNDDGSTGPVSLGFRIDFFGQSFDQVHVNNNGHITFDGPLNAYSAFPLTTTEQQIIAPFFADIDTRAGNRVTYGTDVVDGHSAFGVTWPGVGYYSQHTDKTNFFQVVLIDRADTGVGNFDIEFNYAQIQWQAGDASGGSGGLGGQPPRAGFSNGTGAPGTFYELPGSGVSGAFLDGAATSLVGNSMNSDVLGRYVFYARAGAVTPDAPPTIETPADQFAEATSAEGAIVVYPPATATDSDGNPANVAYSRPSGSVFAIGDTVVTVTASDGAGLESSAEFLVTVVDTTAPNLTVPDDLTVEATSAEGAVVDFAAFATDLVDADVTIEYFGGEGQVVFDGFAELSAFAVARPASFGAPGSLFPLGTTLVNVTATDDFGNQSFGSFTVTVVDTTPPTISVPENLVVEATGAQGATVVNFGVSAADAVDAQPTIQFSTAEGSVFGLGATPVDVTATDVAGNVTTSSFLVTVVDTTSPSATANAIAGDEGSPVDLEVTFSDLVAQAIGDFTVAIDWGDGATAPASITDNGDGTFTVTDSHTFANNGAFPVTVTVTDAAGNSNTLDLTAEIANVNPTVLLGADTIGSVGAGFDRAASFTDPGADEWTATVNYGDGSGNQALALNADKTFSLEHTYAAEGTFTVTVSIFDGTGLGIGSFQINVFIAGFDDVSSGVAQPGEAVAVQAVGSGGQVGATLKRDPNATGTGGIFVATFDATADLGIDESDPSAQNFAVLASFDIRGVNLGDGDEVELTFTFPAPVDPAALPQLMFVKADGSLAPVQPAAGTTIKIVGNTITITLDGTTSFPLVSDLTGTVFTIGVTVPPAPTATPTASANSAVAASTPAVSLPTSTTTVNVSPALALALPTNSSSTSDSGNGGLTRTTTFQAGTQLGFALTSSQSQAAAKAGGTDEEQANEGADPAIRGVGAETDDPALLQLLIRTLQRFWPWADMSDMAPTPALPATPAADSGAFLAPLDAVLAQLELAAADEQGTILVPALDAALAESTEANAGPLGLGWLVPAVVVGLAGTPARAPERRKRAVGGLGA